jgi:hypothetical protein
MDQAETVMRVIKADSTAKRAYEKYGWMILSANAILGILAAVVTTAPSLVMAPSLHFESAYPILGALGTALVGFNILAFVIVLIPYKRYERWAWYTLWLLPLQWISQFILSPDVSYLVLAVLTTVGLILPYRRFFSGSEESPA